MAGILDPFNPGTDTSPFGGIDPQTYDKVRGEWDSFLTNPQGRAALLSAGLALMQPPSFGDTASGQIGRAIGAAGESASRNESMDLKKLETTSKDEARQAKAEAGFMNAESRATAAEARAGAAGARNEASAAKLDMQRQGHQLKLFQGYYADMAKRRAANQNAKLLGQPEQPIPSLQEWVATGGPLTAGLGGGNPEDDTVIPPGADTTSKPAVSAAPKVGERKQFKQGWGVWDGSAWMPER